MAEKKDKPKILVGRVQGERAIDRARCRLGILLRFIPKK
jgi:hypothetical protein